MPGVSRGDKEALLNGSGVSDNDLDSTMFSIHGSLGCFFTNHIEGQGRQGLGFITIEDGGSTWTGSTRVAGDCHFDFERLSPFVGASIGVVYGDDVAEEGWSLGFEGGVKYFVNTTTFLAGMIEYDWLLDDDDDGGSFDDGQFVYVVGIGFRG